MEAKFHPPTHPPTKPGKHLAFLHSYHAYYRPSKYKYYKPWEHGE